MPATELQCVMSKKTLKLLSKIPPCVGKAHEAMWKGSFLFPVQGRQKPNTSSRLGKGEREKRKSGSREKGQTKEPRKRLQEKLASTFSGTEDEKKADLKKS